MALKGGDVAQVSESSQTFEFTLLDLADFPDSLTLLLHCMKDHGMHNLSDRLKPSERIKLSHKFLQKPQFEG